jgi:NADH-quinone oxidoreductase subunit G
MPKLTINGKEIEVPAGTNLIEASKMVGAEVPHFCYHPGLSVAGNCRMCLVEIEKAPKLQIACNTPVAEGMVVLTESDKVKKARQGVMEFLLLNHPIDCPICDCAGECYLQDYYMAHDAKSSRFDEGKNKKQKAEDIGPHVMLDKERCVLCSRCVRFTDEISKTHELGIFGRGSTEEIDLAPGMRLENDYSGNVVDLCPVGALTDKDFRFKSRPWFLKETKTVCAGCSMGCNIVLNTNTNPYNKVGQKRAYRIYPRENADINKFWICDAGRYSYHAYDDNRKEGATLAGVEVTLDFALDRFAMGLKKAMEGGADKVALLLSPQMTNEELAAWKGLAQGLGLSHVSYGDDIKRSGNSDDFLIKADKNPNSRGAADLGLEGAAKDLLALASSGALKGLVVVDHELANAAELAGSLEFFAGLSTHMTATDKAFHVALPRAMHVEQDGSFTNVQGTRQSFSKAMEPIGESRSASSLAEMLLQRLGAAKAPAAGAGAAKAPSGSEA